MKGYNCVTIIILLAIFKSIVAKAVTDTDSLIVSTTEESTKEANKEDGQDEPLVNPQIYSMEIRTNVSNRFATTLITSRVKNHKKTAEETTFAVILPENAFISEFLMEIDGKTYKAYVKEKEEAKKIYQEAVATGRSAAHVELSARDSKNFKVSVNIEPESKTIFRLKYEELLQRQVGQYELILNIHPGQIVDNLDVEVHINESRPLTFVRTPSLRSGNEIGKEEEELKPLADIEVVNSASAIVKFHPDKEHQEKFAGLLGTDKENGLSGQFVVQYDVERDPQGGEVLVRDGYFVHFFAPSDLEPLPKHVVFVLDYSGSMMWRKIEQLTEAMQKILSQLRAEDVFSIVRFSDSASVWDVKEDKFKHIDGDHGSYGVLGPHLREANLPAAVEASPENIAKAKEAVQHHGSMDLTNIIAGLEVGLFLVRSTEEKVPGKYQPLVIFLTDGQPNVGISSTDEITEIVTKLNSGANRASIFSLSFGDSADKKFLQLLSEKNLGFSRHIYEAADSSLQLQDFYRKISSPLLRNVTFKYVEGVSDVTTTIHPLLFNGSELVVAGRTNNLDNIWLHVDGISSKGLVNFTPVKKEPISSIERLWAYLTVEQLLKERETATNATEVTKKALDLALKYSFVTKVTSLVVVKPNETEVESQGRRAPERNFISKTLSTGHSFKPTTYSGPHFVRFGGAPMAGLSGFSSYSRNLGIQKSYLPGLPSSSGHFRRINLMRAEDLDLSIIQPSTTPTTKFNDLRVTTPSSDVLPEWLDDLQVNHQNITTSLGTFLLGKSGDDVSKPSCPKTPLNGTGECKIIFDCPQVFSLLTNLNTYLQYFCPLKEYAGVCCPTST